MLDLSLFHKNGPKAEMWCLLYKICFCENLYLNCNHVFMA